MSKKLMDDMTRERYSNSMKQYLTQSASIFVATIAVFVGTTLSPAYAQGSYQLQPGDKLRIMVWKEPELDREMVVSPDGSISFPLVGAINASGNTVTALQRIITDGLRNYISDPVVTVTIEEVRGNKIYVVGQVNRPGEFVVNPMVDVLQALSMAGGTTPFASVSDITIIKRSGDKQWSVKFDLNDISRGRDLSGNIILSSGDVVVVP